MNKYEIEFILLHRSGSQSTCKTIVLASSLYEAEEIVRDGISRTSAMILMFTDGRKLWK